MEWSGELRSGALVAGAFRIVKPLASGAMGAVYVAEQLSTSKRRALKVMRADLLGDARLCERFIQEARIGASIESEHVVEVIDAGIDPERGLPWLAMELLEGETLAERLATDGPLPVAVVREIFAQLGHALGSAHERGIVHRDLKPENVFLAAPRREGVPFTLKILDFGIAKIVSEAHTQATAAMGTPLFMSPEQMVPGRGVSPATDVWALGLIAFRLLTGHHYWRAAHVEGTTSMMLLNEVSNLALEPASERAADYGVAALLPEGFDAWFARAVARDPSDRYPDARAARAALDELLAGAAPGASAFGRRSQDGEASAALAADTAGMATDLWLAQSSPESAARVSGGSEPVDPSGQTASSPDANAARREAAEATTAMPLATTTSPTPQRSVRSSALAGFVVVVVLGAGAAIYLTTSPGATPGATEAPTRSDATTEPTAAAMGSTASVSAAPSASSTGTSVSGGQLPPETIQAIIRSHFAYLRRCYEKSLATHPHLRGSVNLHFVVQLDGSVKMSSTEGSTIAEPAVVACVAEAFESVAFPRPQGGTVSVVYPLVFTPAGEDEAPNGSITNLFRP